MVSSDRSVSKSGSRRIVYRQMLIPFVFSVSIGIEYLFPKVYLGPYTLVAIPIGLWIVDRVFRDTRKATEPGRRDWTKLLWRVGTLLPWVLVIALAWTMMA